MKKNNMNEIEIERQTENKSFLLKGIENVFLKFKGVKRQTPEELAITKAQLNAEQERQRAIEEQARVEAENARQYQLLQEKLKKEREAAEKQKQLEIAEKQEKIVKQADMFLEANLLDLYLAMCNNGYQPNKSQKQQIVEHVNSLIVDLKPDVDLTAIENYISKGYTLSSSNSFYLLSQTHFQDKYFSKDLFDLSTNVSLDTKYPKVIESLKNNLATEFFQEYLAKKLLGSLTSNYRYNRTWAHKYTANDYESYPFNFSEVANIPVFMNHMSHIILPKIPVDKFIGFIGEWQKSEYYMKHIVSNPECIIFNSIKELKKIKTSFYETTDLLLKTTMAEHYSKDLTAMIHNTKVISSETYVEEKVVKNTQTLSNNYKVNNLPENTKEIFHDLQKLYDKLEKHIPNLNDDQKFLVENLFDKRIPEVLQKYFSIDEEYRETMKNFEGKNAKDLMDESLTNFKSKLTEVLENINEAKLSDLSVTKRYSKSI